MIRGHLLVLLLVRSFWVLRGESGRGDGPCTLYFYVSYMFLYLSLIVRIAASGVAMVSAAGMAAVYVGKCLL